MIRALLNCLLFPATAAHELTHAALWAPWTRERDIDMRPTQLNASVLVELDPEIPGWAHRLAYLGPLLFGLLFAVLAISWLIMGGGQFPDSVREQGLWAVLGAYWITYTMPSKADLGLE